MDAQALARMAPERRYPILVATAVERLIATSDLVLDLFDTAVGAIDRKARRDRDEPTKAHVVAASDTVSMFARVARILWILKFLTIGFVTQYGMRSGVTGLSRRLSVPIRSKPTPSAVTWNW